MVSSGDVALQHALDVSAALATPGYPPIGYPLMTSRLDVSPMSTNRRRGNIRRIRSSRSLRNANVCSTVVKLSGRMSNEPVVVDEVGLHAYCLQLLRSHRQVLVRLVRVLRLLLDEALRHVEPRHEVARERIEQAPGRLLDLGHTQDVVDVREHDHSFRRHEVRGRVACVCHLSVDVQLDNVAHLRAVGRPCAGRRQANGDRHEAADLAAGIRFHRQAVDGSIVDSQLALQLMLGIQL